MSCQFGLSDCSIPVPHGPELFKSILTALQTIQSDAELSPPVIIGRLFLIPAEAIASYVHTMRSESSGP